jgi:hypothetical protein
MAMGGSEGLLKGKYFQLLKEEPALKFKSSFTIFSGG